jgi:translation initiation factor IF-2
LPIVLKADVAGSLEAIRGSLDKIQSSEVKAKILHAAVGGITENDVLLASTASGLIVGFNVRPDVAAQQLAKQKSVEIKTYRIIYELLDDIKKALGGLLAPEVKESTTGHAQVRELFSVPKVGTVAGCAVVDGKITRQSMVRVLRDGRVVYEGRLASLRRFKDDAKEVQSGYECGIGVENFNDIKVGDTIEAYERNEVAREL